ncbi:MAG: hormogonium polysaccharide secretion pseudopilin HpsB [Coleofasciculus sp.]
MMLPPKPKKLTPSANQAGFTIIESLMAIIVVSIFMIAIAPVIVLSVATRVQARRVEMATQAAQGYIDALRAETIDAPPINTATGNPPELKGIIDDLKEIDPPPTGNLTCDASQYCTQPTSPNYRLYCVDGNGGGCTNDNFKDMIVQAFGVNTTTIPTGTNLTPQQVNQQRAQQGYHLGIRVYRADAFTSGRTLQASTGEREATFTGGTGLKPSQKPLIELTTEIVTGGTSYNDFCNRVGCNNQIEF